jgi:uncharacterized protein (DUF433 family)
MSTAEVEPVTYAYRTPEGTWRVAGSRVSLDSIIDAHRRGETAEQIVRAFPSLSLEHVHGALAFYLHHRVMCDAYMEEQRSRWAEFEQESAERNRDLRDRIRERAASQSGGEQG